MGWRDVARELHLTEPFSNMPGYIYLLFAFNAYFIFRRCNMWVSTRVPKGSVTSELVNVLLKHTHVRSHNSLARSPPQPWLVGFCIFKRIGF